MPADFWAGYVSGVLGIIIGNPLDVIKIRRQTQRNSKFSQNGRRLSHSFVKGTAAPILGYGALNALLFTSYNRSEAALKRRLPACNDSLVLPWVAGLAAGLATWVVSTPTELVKCRTQLSVPTASSLSIARQIWKADGIKGMYFGGFVTALRDSIGYGFYFWSYELASISWPTAEQDWSTSVPQQDMLRVFVCGGLAGIATWVSVFPLDVIKSRIQTQSWEPQRAPATTSKMHHHRWSSTPPQGAWKTAKSIYIEGGLRPFFRGLTICSVRAFIVNAVQWMVYETVIHEVRAKRS